MAEWSPIVMYWQAPATWDAETNTVVDGDEIITRAWRCAKHDKKPEGKESS